MSKVIRIRKGLDIKLHGEAERTIAHNFTPDSFAIKPTDFIGMSPIPKMLVEEGQEVKAGTPLFYDKVRPEVLFTSPVSGLVKEIRRGDKRAITEVIIDAGKEMLYEPFDVAGVADKGREAIIELMLKSGLWTFIRQRPYNTIANPSQKPKAIFISAFDTAPLAPDFDFIVHGKGEAFQAGLDVLVKLSGGPIHLNVSAQEAVSKVFLNSKNVSINTFSGPHPAGNTGIHIHHVAPINKGEVVWYLNPQEVISIGKFFLTGKYDVARIVALTGSEVKSPKYYKTYVGASIKNMLENNVKEGLLRHISGNVLTGKKISASGYVGYYDYQVTVIPEGNEPEFMGWAMPGLNKMSASRTFPAFLFPRRKYSLDTLMHGEERAYVMSGQYEKVLPMDIYPVYLIKAIMSGNIDKMEQLGIYEVAEEDLALCEYVCTSKIEVQKIIRQGLDHIRKEME